MCSYLAGMLGRMDCPAVLVGCAEDHVHVLCVLSKNLSVAQLVAKLKSGSSKWAKTKDKALESFQWQNGYAAFSVSPSKVGEVERYIATQKEHHRREYAQDDYRY